MVLLGLYRPTKPIHDLDVFISELSVDEVCVELGTDRPQTLDVDDASIPREDATVFAIKSSENSLHCDTQKTHIDAREDDDERHDSDIDNVPENVRRNRHRSVGIEHDITKNMSEKNNEKNTIRTAQTLTADGCEGTLVVDDVAGDNINIEGRNTEYLSASTDNEDEDIPLRIEPGQALHEVFGFETATQSTPTGMTQYILSPDNAFKKFQNDTNEQFIVAEEENEAADDTSHNNSEEEYDVFDSSQMIQDESQILELSVLPPRRVGLPPHLEDSAIISSPAKLQLTATKSDAVEAMNSEGSPHIELNVIAKRGCEFNTNQETCSSPPTQHTSMSFDASVCSPSSSKSITLTQSPCLDVHLRESENFSSSHDEMMDNSAESNTAKTSFLKGPWRHSLVSRSATKNTSNSSYRQRGGIVFEPHTAETAKRRRRFKQTKFPFKKTPETK